MDKTSVHNVLVSLNSELTKNNFNFELEFLNNCDVIGFDLDHTLAVYNTESMSELLLYSFTKFLVDHKNYPEELHKLDNDSNVNKEFALKMMGTDLILDCVHGNGLRIDEEKRVIKAFHGFKELNKDEV